MDFGPYTTKKDTLGGIKLTNDKQGILEDLLNGNVVNDYTVNKIGKILFPDNPEGPFKIEMGFGTDSADETIANRKQKVLKPTFTGMFAFLEAYKFAKLYERSFNKANKYDYKNKVSSNPIDKFCVPLRIFVPNDTDLATESIKENKMTRSLNDIRNQMKSLVEESTVKVEESYIIANKPIRSDQQILYITKPTGNYIKIKQFPGTFDKSKAWRFSTKQAAEEGLMDSMAVMGLDSYDRHQRIQNFEIIQD